MIVPFCWICGWVGGGFWPRGAPSGPPSSWSLGVFEVAAVVVLHQPPPDEQREAGENHPFHGVEEVQPVDLLRPAAAGRSERFDGAAGGCRADVGAAGQFGRRGDKARVAADVPVVDEFGDRDGAGAAGVRGRCCGSGGSDGSSRPVSSMVPDGGAAASAGSATQPRATGIQVCGEAAGALEDGGVRRRRRRRRSSSPWRRR